VKEFFAAIGATFIAALCAIAFVWLAWHHPLSPATALLLCGAVTALAFGWPERWALWLFPALPLAGLATWTGWLAVEELDLLVLAVAAGGNARLALGKLHPGERSSALALSWLWLLPVVFVTLLALWRGLEGAGANGFGWWQGWREPANTGRMAKSLFGALVLMPLARAGWRDDLAAASNRLTTALTAALLVTGLSVLWERLAFTGLLDFSSDYRATGLFWEMHVGGAALDAVLAMTMPFAAAALAQARRPLAALLPCAALALGAYACLVTFSRIVYIAVPLGLVLGWLLASRGAPRPGARGWLAAALWLLGFLALAAWLFPGSGYRGLLALLGAVMLMLPLQGLRSRIDGGPLALALAGGLLGGGALAALALALPKGAYLFYAVAWLLGAAMLVWVWTRGQRAGVLVALGAAMAVVVAVPAVGLHWGGEGAGLHALPVAALLALVLGLAAFRRAPSWPDDLRWQARLVAAMVLAAAGVGVFGGGAYMGGRVLASGGDSQDRGAHWRDSLALLHGPLDWVFGKGLGRFPAEHALSGRAEDETGDYRLSATEDGQVLQLSSGRHALGSGEIFRLSQRVAPPQAGGQPPLAGAGQPPLAARLRLKLRNDDKLVLVAEVCAKNLLYPQDCASGALEVAAAPKPGDWQAVEIRLAGRPPEAGWLARPIVFSLGTDSPGRQFSVDQLSLVDGQGRELLDNGDFEAGLAHWYFTSDRWHLPWHAKNAAVHLLFEQGVLGLAAWLVALGVALWRLTLGAARGRPLAAPLAAALVGVAVVGAVDSLFDMPRVAFLLTCLLTLALTIPPPRQGRGRRIRLHRA
jgi:hypothetical protein